MVWFKVDDTLSAHPKARRAGLAAMGLWTLAGSWSAQQLTDGFVPAWFVEGWPQGRRHAATLVAAGFWTPDTVEGEDGWRFHQWTERNPTRAEVEAERAAAKQRMRKTRDKRKRSADVPPNVLANGQRTNGERSGEVRPGVRLPRPDPTLPTSGHQSSDVRSGDAREHEHSIAGSITAAYAAGVPLSDHGRALRTIAAALDAGYTPDLVRRGVGRLIAEQRTCTPDALRIAITADDQPPAGQPPRRRTATEKANGWLTVGLDDQDERPALRALPGGAG